jgi:hypothetical protein
MILGTGLRPFESGGAHEMSLARTSHELLPFLTVPVPVLEVRYLNPDIHVKQIVTGKANTLILLANTRCRDCLIYNPMQPRLTRCV